MPTKKPSHHLFTTTDPNRGKHYPQCCNACGLPERNTVHTLRPVDADTQAAENARYADKD